MAQLTKDPISGAYQVKQGDTLSKIATTQGRTLAELQASNPQLFRGGSGFNIIQPGQSVNIPPPRNIAPPGTFDYQNPAGPQLIRPQSTPSLAGLTSGSNNRGSSYSPSSSATSSSGSGTSSFTEALIAMLKEAQGRDQAGQASLMKQSQGITGLGLNDANRNFRNKKLAPNSGTSLGLSAQNEFDPLQLSIANQQKLASQNLGNITDLIDRTQDGYDKEQDRLERAEEKRLDLIEKEKDRAASRANKSSSFDTDSNTSAVSKKMQAITGPDGYIDPYAWKAMRNLWQGSGGADSSFVSNFKRFVNPASYTLVGLETDFAPLF